MIIKRGECHSKVTLSSSLFRCAACGHTDVDSSGVITGRACPSCGVELDLISHSEEGAGDEPNKES